ncbi:hypothetical protein [Burkholderia gladioli]|nr:hypothetical protein [Burkholderia gladioli]
MSEAAQARDGFLLSFAGAAIVLGARLTAATTWDVGRRALDHQLDDA